MLKKCNRILAFLLALVLVITTFKSDFNGLRVFASEQDEIIADDSDKETAGETEETEKTVEEELPELFEEVKKVEEVPAGSIVPVTVLNADDAKLTNTNNLLDNSKSELKTEDDADKDVELQEGASDLNPAEAKNIQEQDVEFDSKIILNAYVNFIYVDVNGETKQDYRIVSWDADSYDDTYEYQLPLFNDIFRNVSIEGQIFDGWKKENNELVKVLTLSSNSDRSVTATWKNVEEDNNDDEISDVNVIVYHKNINDVESEEDRKVVSLGDFKEGETKKSITPDKYTKVFGEIEDKAKEFLGWKVVAVTEGAESITELTGENTAFDAEKDGKYDLYAIWGDAEPATYTVTYQGVFYNNGTSNGTQELEKVEYPANYNLTYEEASKKAQELSKKKPYYTYDDIFANEFLTKSFTGIGELKEDTTIYVRCCRGIDNRVYFFLLGKVYDLTSPSAGPQASEEYYPDKNNETGEKYIWTGTANHIDRIPEENLYIGTDGYKSVYNWNGFDNSIVGYKYDPGTDINISKYLLSEYGADFTRDDIVWYVYKKHKDGNHIDGYVTSYVTYHANEDKLIGGIVEDKTTVQDKKERYGYRVNILENNMFTPVNKGYEFLGWSTNKDATTPDPEYTVEKLKENPTVILDKKYNLYAVWKSTEAKYKLVIQVDAEGADKDTYLKYDGNVHYANVNVKVNAELIKKESAKAENNTGIAVASIANKLRSSFSNAVSSALKFGTITAYAAEPKKTDPVDEVKTTIEDGTEVIVKGLKTIADPGIDVGNYDVNLDYSGLEIIRTSDGQDIKDLFEVEVVRSSTGGQTITETSKPTDPKKPKLIAQLHILKRNVVLSSGSASKQYDGTPLTRDGVSIGGDGFANGTRGQEGATYNVTGSQTEVGNSSNPFTYTLKPENTFADNYNITVNYGTLTVTPVGGDNPPPEDTPPTVTPPAEGQVLGAVRPVDGAAVLGARRGRTEDSANTLGRIITIIVAAGIGFTMIFIKRKKNEE